MVDEAIYDFMDFYTISRYSAKKVENMNRRILNVIATVDPTHGGPIEGVVQMAQEMIRLGWSVEIVSLDRPDDRWVTNQVLPCHAIGPAVGNYAFSVRLVPWMRKNAKKYDAVIVHGLWNYVSYATWRALRRAGIGYFVFVHGMLDPFFKRQYPMKHLKKYIYWMLAERHVICDARGVFFTSAEERRLSRLSFPMYRCKEILVPYGTAGAIGRADDQREQFLSRFPHLRATRNLLFIGRLHEKKGLDLTLRALRQCISDVEAVGASEIHLIIAGPCESSYAAAMQDLAVKLGVSRHVTWTGMLRGDMKWGAFRVADAFVLNSHQENFCIAAAEALSASVPVLITDKVNIWQEILEDEAGFVESDDVGGAIALLSRWLASPPAEWARMRANAKQCFDARFHVSMAARALLENVSPPRKVRDSYQGDR